MTSHSTSIFRYLTEEGFLKTLASGLRFKSCNEYWIEEDVYDGRMPDYLYFRMQETSRRFARIAASDLVQFGWLYQGLSVPKEIDEWSQNIYVSCWSHFSQEKDMWDKFSKSKDGVILESSKEKLKNYLGEKLRVIPIGINAETVVYISSFENDDEYEKAYRILCSRNFGGFRVIAHAFIKTARFERENEFRIAVHNWGNEIPTSKDGCLYFEDFMNQVERVWIHPDADLSYERDVVSALKNVGSQANVVRLEAL